MRRIETQLQWNQLDNIQMKTDIDPIDAVNRTNEGLLYWKKEKED